MKNKLLQGLSGGSVDDLIRTRNKNFKTFAKKTNHIFEMAEDQDLPCVFTEFSLERYTDGTKPRTSMNILGDWRKYYLIARSGLSARCG